MRKIMISSLCILLIGFSLLPACSEEEDQTVSEQLAEQEAYDQNQMSILAAKNGIRDQVNINSFDMYKYDFSISVSDRFSGRDVVFISTIDDIIRRNGKTYIISVDWLNNTWYDLEVSESKCTELLGGIDRDEYSFFDDYYILARIERVSKSRAVLSAYGNEESGFEYEIDIPGQFIFSGSFIDMTEYVYID